MSKSIRSGLLAIAFLALTGHQPAWAISPERFAGSSVLATGKWVKVYIGDDGMYQLTTEQLAQMGFSDPSRVRVYGQGGHAMAEVFNKTITDDLIAVPTLHRDGKVYFYGKGSVGRELHVENSGQLVYYSHTRNTYATRGCYFITESDTPAALPQTLSADGEGTNWLTSSYDMFLHENESVSLGLTGKMLLGESIYPDAVSIPYRLPQRADSTIAVRIGAAAKAAYTTFFQASVNSGGTITSVGYSTTQGRIGTVASNDPQRHFNYGSAQRAVKLAGTDEEGTLIVKLNNSYQTTVKLAHLDYAVITYQRHNRYDGTQGYFAMGYPALGDTDRVVLPGADARTIVWDITDTRDIKQMALTPAVDSDGQTVGMGFLPGERAAPSEFVVFNTDMEMPTISGYEPIENQNLHALSTPDMLIITNQYFMPEAERLAQLHRDQDGMTVHVIDQELVFNEFSSGTPDAMAIRLFCKMLYDRDRAAMVYRFKHLLMFGPASYDYRGMTTDKPNRVITYESDESDSDAYSYGTDDFFAMLDDNCSTYMVNNKIRLGVGRLTPIDLEQARQNVDKIAHYVANPDYGSWRNHYMILADTGDGYLHELQADAIDEKIQNTLKLPLIGDKAYVDLFPLEGLWATIARQHVVEMLNSGQYYGTYIGHANPNAFTSKRMWTKANVTATSYDRQPILMTACCDVARYDGEAQGIAELMFHQPNGGAIALLTSSREVESSQNDNLNHAFTEAMFGYLSTGEMTTLGQAYMKAKQSTRVWLNMNKMSYLLLGDPAIKVEYPRPLFNITHINGQSASSADISLSPMQPVEVRATVTTSSGQQDNSFNGDATLSIYDVKAFFKNASYSNGNIQIEGDIYYPRTLLVEVQGRVENGVFTGKAVLPQNIKAQAGETLAIHVYAHKDNSNEMVNGAQEVKAALFDEAVAVTDDEAPVIESMYLNEAETFAQGYAVAPNSTLHVTATDDVAFNNQTSGVGTSAKLILDGKTSYPTVRNYVTVSDGGRLLEVNFPLNGLSAGKHTLTVHVQDVSGKAAQQTITFMVGGESGLTLATDNLVAVDEAVITLDESDLTATPPITLKVVDAHGRLVWNTTTASLPCSWDLTDNDGQRVAPGLYKMFGQFDDGTNRGGTNISPIIVMDRVHRAKSE